MVRTLVEGLSDRDRLELVEFSFKPSRWNRKPVQATEAQSPITNTSTRRIIRSIFMLPAYPNARPLTTVHTPPQFSKYTPNTDTPSPPK